VNYRLSQTVMVERPTAVIAATTTWEAFPSLWPRLLDEVWKAVRSVEGVTPGRNIMLYKDDAPSVEIGVEVAEPFVAAGGRVVGSALPGGRVASTFHEGPPESLARDVGGAHKAVADWCLDRGLRPTGTRWEVYGHWHDDSVEQEVEVFYLLG
jgi:effector-binding domain-containing protein